jgi:hypothetical protein
MCVVIFHHILEDRAKTAVLRRNEIMHKDKKDTARNFYIRIRQKVWIFTLGSDFEDGSGVRIQWSGFMGQVSVVSIQWSYNPGFKNSKRAQSHAGLMAKGPGFVRPTIQTRGLVCVSCVESKCVCS